VNPPTLPSAVAELVIVGAGGHARVVADIARLTGHTVVGFLDEVDPGRRGTAFAGAAILGGLEQVPALTAAGVRQAVVAIGDCTARLRVAALVTEAGLQLSAMIHPRAIHSADATIGPGTVLAAGTVVNPATQIGANVIVNTAATVDHDCVIEDGVHIACGAHVAGHVHVGRGSWVGMGALVRERVRIGAHTLVGAGALVLKDLPDHVVAYGSPAKIIQHV
jgi:sugar O-acyltransferase (sialic acid O-acetyltransferase NeuD family)